MEILKCDVGMRHEFAEALKVSFMHLVRNSLDHGIEAPNEREKSGKPVVGKVTFELERGEQSSKLFIGDDGRGLALHALLDKGRKHGYFADGTPSLQDISEVIFKSGVSTAESVSMVSGRGVGMDAVRAFLAEHGAKVSIALSNPNGHIGFMPFKFVIEMDNSLMQP